MLPLSWNRTFLCFIPKLQYPDYRPISLCNVNYRILAKALANRLTPFLLDLIGPEQSAYVPGRSMTDSILLVQEAVHSMCSLKKKKSIVLLKLDLEGWKSNSASLSPPSGYRSRIPARLLVIRVKHYGPDVRIHLDSIGLRRRPNA